MHKTTCEKLGDTLPIGGDVPTGDRARRFAFKAWRVKDEREIGAIRDRDRSLSHSAFAAEVLAHFLTVWQDRDVAALSRTERRVLLSRSYAADVFYAWVALRRTALGDELDAELRCGFCQQTFPYTLYLNSMDVVVADDDEVLRRGFRLRDGMEWKGQTRHVLTLAPVRWHVYEAITDDGSLNTGVLKARMLAGSIVAIEGVEGDVMIPPEGLDLSKYDLEALSGLINDWEPGPDLALEVQCPKCRTTMAHSVPWVYDNFFSLGRSSRGVPSLRSERRSSDSVTTSPGSSSTSTG